MARTLDRQLLDRLDLCLRQHNPAVLDQAVPGPHPDEIRWQLRSFPGRVPSELITWWSYRQWGPDLVLPGAQFCTVEEALRAYAIQRDLAENQVAVDYGDSAVADEYWPPQWLPVMGRDGIVFVADTADGNEHIAPIKYFESISFRFEEYGRVIAESLGDFVYYALEEIAAGIWVISHTGDWISSDDIPEPGPRPLIPRA
ncbi:MAG: hypothetical protein M3313_15690 [Actinomycetota bacterium]|nr:hypothetical protein [Actinomycetota bacterium]